MACLLANLLFLFLLVTAAVRLAHWQGNRGWNDALRQMAIRFRGTWHAGNWLYEPAVTFRHGEAHARLSAIKLGGGARCLQLSLQQSDVACRCEIHPRQKSRDTASSEHARHATEFAWEAFGSHWIAASGSGADVRPLLTDGVRLAFTQLLQSVNGHSASQLGISLAPGWLVVRKSCRAPSAPEFEQFVERVLSLADQFQLAIATGIEFVKKDQPQLLEAQRCGVCGESLVSDIVVCRRCQTPHHQDCWQYGGACATYACGSRECYVPECATLQTSTAAKSGSIVRS